MDYEQARRDTEDDNHPARVVAQLLKSLDNPTSEWHKLSPPSKVMIRTLVKGLGNGEAAKQAERAQNATPVYANKSETDLKCVKSFTTVDGSRWRHDQRGLSVPLSGSLSSVVRGE